MHGRSGAADQGRGPSGSGGLGRAVRCPFSPPRPRAAAAPTPQDPPWPPSSLRRSRDSGTAALSPLLGTARLWREQGQCLGTGLSPLRVRAEASHRESRVSELGKAVGLSPPHSSSRGMKPQEPVMPRSQNPAPPAQHPRVQDEHTDLPQLPSGWHSVGLQQQH